MPVKITVTSNLFTYDVPQDAIVREDLKIAALLAEIKREFNLPNGEYVLILKESGHILDPKLAVAETPIRTGSTLFVTTRQHSHAVRSVSPKTSGAACLRVESTGQTLYLRSTTNVIGRQSEQGQQVDIDLTPLDTGKSVSRRHASIDQTGSGYCIQSLRPQNLAYVNGSAVPPGEQRPIKNGDRLTFGQVTLIFDTAG